ncbi:MAG: hypothetical protein J6M06_02860, partial [Synergistaceae bacterium]|nr:hypothetical protein [Synergistaceae bacterium]
FRCFYTTKAHPVRKKFRAGCAFARPQNFGVRNPYFLTPKFFGSRIGVIKTTSYAGGRQNISQYKILCEQLSLFEPVDPFAGKREKKGQEKSPRVGGCP